jgi:large subunit ribosomal protein L9
MEVILREHVDNLGRRGEVVKVAEGYARNFLLPRRLALPVTEANKRQIERERVKFEAKDAEERRGAEAIAERIAAADVKIARRVGENDTLYGSVTAADITDALQKQGIGVDRRKVQLAEAIKQLGEVNVPIKIHRDVTAQVTVKVVKEGSA